MLHGAVGDHDAPNCPSNSTLSDSWRDFAIASAVVPSFEAAAGSAPRSSKRCITSYDSDSAACTTSGVSLRVRFEVDVCTVVEQDIDHEIVACQMKWGDPFIVLDVDVGTQLNEKRRHLGLIFTNDFMKRCEAEFVRLMHQFRGRCS